MQPLEILKGHYNKLQDVETAYDVFKFLKGLAKQYNFTHFAIKSMPSEGDEELSALILVSNWPPELFQAYDEMGLLHKSPVFAALRTSTTPLFWEINEISKTREEEEAAKAVELFSSFDMGCGVHFPAYTSAGRRGAVSFNAKSISIDPVETMLLHMLSLYTFDHLIKILETSCERAPKLTRRERDCVLWSAQGKTTAEVGTILEISEHTVSGYIHAACQKLDAVNKTHVVAKSLRLGLLE